MPCFTICNHMKMTFICMLIKSQFHMKEWLPRLALKNRAQVIRKWFINIPHFDNVNAF